MKRTNKRCLVENLGKESRAASLHTTVHARHLQDPNTMHAMIQMIARGYRGQKTSMNVWCDELALVSCSRPQNLERKWRKTYMEVWLSYVTTNTTKDKPVLLECLPCSFPSVKTFASCLNMYIQSAINIPCKVGDGCDLDWLGDRSEGPAWGGSASWTSLAWLIPGRNWDFWGRCHCLAPGVTAWHLSPNKSLVYQYSQSFM